MFFQILSNLSWLHVIAAAIAYFITGAAWYSPVLFSKPWAKMQHINMNAADARKGMAMMMFGSFLLMIICCTGLAVMYRIIPIDDAAHAVKFGLFFGVTFAATMIGITFIYEKRPLGVYLIDTGYHIVGCIIASLVLVLWR